MITLVLFVGAILSLLYFYNGLRPKNFPPGLWNFPILGSAPLVRTPMHQYFAKLSENYGKVFSLHIMNYPTVVISDSELIREAFKQDAFSARPDIRMFTERSWGKKRGIIFNEGKDWQEQRRFALRNMRDFGFGKMSMEALIQNEVFDFVLHLSKSVDKPVALARQFNLPVLNALWNIIAGERFSYDDESLKDLLREMMQNFTENEPNGVLFFMPWLTKLAPKLSGWDDFMALLPPALAFLSKPIEEHKKTYDPNNIRDLIDVYLQEISKTTDPKSEFYKENGEKTLMMILLDLFSAGAETVSSGLNFATLYLINFPELQEKIQAEIDLVIGLRTPALSDRPQMHLMEAFIAEMLRYASFTPLGLFHATQETVEFHGYSIPKGTIIFPNLWQVHFDKKLWGDPKNFRPERFLDDNGHFVENKNLMAFSVGKRVCLGEKLARDELFLFLTGLLQKFTFKPEGSAPSIDDLLEGFTLKPKPFNIILSVRDN